MGKLIHLKPLLTNTTNGNLRKVNNYRNYVVHPHANAKVESEFESNVNEMMGTDFTVNNNKNNRMNDDAKFGQRKNIKVPEKTDCFMELNRKAVELNESGKLDNLSRLVNYNSKKELVKKYVNTDVDMDFIRKARTICKQAEREESKEKIKRIMKPQNKNARPYKEKVRQQLRKNMSIITGCRNCNQGCERSSENCARCNLETHPFGDQVQDNEVDATPHNEFVRERVSKQCINEEDKINNLLSTNTVKYRRLIQALRNRTKTTIRVQVAPVENVSDAEMFCDLESPSLIFNSRLGKMNSKKSKLDRGKITTRAMLRQYSKLLKSEAATSFELRRQIEDKLKVISRKMNYLEQFKNNHTRRCSFCKFNIKGSGIEVSESTKMENNKTYSFSNETAKQPKKNLVICRTCKYFLDKNWVPDGRFDNRLTEMEILINQKELLRQSAPKKRRLLAHTREKQAKCKTPRVILKANNGILSDTVMGLKKQNFKLLDTNRKNIAIKQHLKEKLIEALKYLQNNEIYPEPGSSLYEESAKPFPLSVALDEIRFQFDKNYTEATQSKLNSEMKIKQMLHLKSVEKNQQFQKKENSPAARIFLDRKKDSGYSFNNDTARNILYPNYMCDRFIAGSPKSQEEQRNVEILRNPDPLHLLDTHKLQMPTVQKLDEHFEPCTMCQNPVNLDDHHHHHHQHHCHYDHHQQPKVEMADTAEEQQVCELCLHQHAPQTQTNFYPYNLQCSRISDEEEDVFRFNQYPPFDMDTWRKQQNFSTIEPKLSLHETENQNELNNEVDLATNTTSPDPPPPEQANTENDIDQNAEQVVKSLDAERNNSKFERNSKITSLSRGMISQQKLNRAKEKAQNNNCETQKSEDITEHKADPEPDVEPKRTIDLNLKLIPKPKTLNLIKSLEGETEQSNLPTNKNLDPLSTMSRKEIAAIKHENYQLLNLNESTRNLIERIQAEADALTQSSYKVAKVEKTNTNIELSPEDNKECDKECLENTTAEEPPENQEPEEKLAEDKNCGKSKKMIKKLDCALSLKNGYFSINVTGVDAVNDQLEKSIPKNYFKDKKQQQDNDLVTDPKDIIYLDPARKFTTRRYKVTFLNKNNQIRFASPSESRLVTWANAFKLIKEDAANTMDYSFANNKEKFDDKHSASLNQFLKKTFELYRGDNLDERGCLKGFYDDLFNYSAKSVITIEKVPLKEAEDKSIGSSNNLIIQEVELKSIDEKTQEDQSLDGAIVEVDPEEKDDVAEGQVEHIE